MWEASICSNIFVFTLEVRAQKLHCHNPSSVFHILLRMNSSRSKKIDLTVFVNFSYVRLQCIACWAELFAVATVESLSRDMFRLDMVLAGGVVSSHIITITASVPSVFSSHHFRLDGINQCCNKFLSKSKFSRVYCNRLCFLPMCMVRAFLVGHRVEQSGHTKPELSI